MFTSHYTVILETPCDFQEIYWEFEILGKHTMAMNQ